MFRQKIDYHKWFFVNMPGMSKAEFVLAEIEYAFYGKKPCLSAEQEKVWKPIQLQIDCDNRWHDTIRKINEELDKEREEEEEDE